jgi:uncharacterized caspase-like protein
MGAGDWRWKIPGCSFGLAVHDQGRFKKDHVRLLLDEEATTRNIKSELNLLARSAGRDDLVLIYLASHGSARESDVAGVNYVITHDTDVGDPDSLYATALPMVEVVNVVRNRVKSRRAVVILDTCYSGGALAPGARFQGFRGEPFCRFRRHSQWSVPR